jgi:hypothetical protein
MKKLFITAVIAIAVSASAFAAPTTVNARIASRFSSDFADATNVEWKTTDSYTKASFVLDGKTVEAFYNLQGEIIGTSTAINVSVLPKKAQNTIAVKYAGYALKEAISFTDADDVKHQYISLEKENTKLAFEVFANGTLSLLSKKIK